ncbi:DedA family protein [Antrihabitans cavernicola]|uniref:DedA family protein n=1 Tax=Antrihabitans cavernicola TaxID=2495913 RepID=A0A5A7SAZ7_9NOCA|nr:DedA family protein [Spelaeibacter cavernicola]KAA0021705.1 DedA family protein [Spelaeibacter cavernicola]
MNSIVERVLDVSPIWVFLVVGAIVFAEDALFVGFVLPGETAAIIGGVDASRGHVNLIAMIVVVVAAAIIGDTVGYEVGKHGGPRIMEMSVLDKHRDRLEKAQDMLARRGGIAVFLGRFTAFFRAVMPALAGLSRMPYRRFVTYNALGGLTWGIGCVLLGFAAGNSYEAVAKTAGRVSALVVAAIVVIGIVIWQVRKRRSDTESV